MITTNCAPICMKHKKAPFLKKITKTHEPLNEFFTTAKCTYELTILIFMRGWKYSSGKVVYQP